MFAATHKINPHSAAIQLLGIYSPDLEEWELETEQDKQFIGSLTDYLKKAYMAGFEIGRKHEKRLHRLGVHE